MKTNIDSAILNQVENGYTSTFERHLSHSIEQVWEMLTENEKLKEWFSELHIDELREGGLIKFDMQDGTFEEMEILDLKMNAILEFTWDKDIVRFELYPESKGCRLIFIEKNQQHHRPHTKRSYRLACLPWCHSSIARR